MRCEKKISEYIHVQFCSKSSSRGYKMNKFWHKLIYGKMVGALVRTCMVHSGIGVLYKILLMHFSTIPLGVLPWKPVLCTAIEDHRQPGLQASNTSQIHKPPTQARYTSLLHLLAHHTDTFVKFWMLLPYFLIQWLHLE